MVKVKFFGLIRSNHNLTEMDVESGTVRDIINQIKQAYPTLTEQEFQLAVLVINQEKVMHLNRFSILINDGDELVFTNFVGGG